MTTPDPGPDPGFAARLRAHLPDLRATLERVYGDAAPDVAERLVAIARAAHAARPDDLRARIERIHSAGPTVKVELSTEGGPAQAEISQEQYEALHLRRGEDVFVRPRHKRVFAEDYTI